MAKTQRRRRRLRTKPMGPVTATWFALGAIINAASAIVGSVTLLIVGVLSVLIGLISWTVGERATTTARPGGSPGKPIGTARRTSARPATRKPPQRSSPQLPKQRCTARCQRSVKPASTCDCSCGGRWHGAQVAGTRAALLTPQAKQRDKARAAGRIRNVIDD